MSSKYSLQFPKIRYENFSNPYLYRDILESFYRQNILGFDYKDIEEERKITVLEFDLNDVPEYPFSDTLPENVEKELLKDYLFPLLEFTQKSFCEEIRNRYLEMQIFGDSAILNLKEQYLDRINSIIVSVKASKHLTAGFKKPLLDSLEGTLEYIELNVSTNFAEDFSQKKIKFRLNAKEVCHLMKYLNHKEILDRKYEDGELAELIEMHFQHQVGRSNNFKNFVNTAQQLSNSIRSKNHNSHSQKLTNILKDYSTTMIEIEKAK